MMLRLHSSRDIVGVMMMMMSRSAQDGVSAVVDDADGDGLLFQISPCADHEGEIVCVTAGTGASNQLETVSPKCEACRTSHTATFKQKC